MPRRPSGPVEESSPLRRARLARNWTLEDVVEEIDLRTPGGHSGVTPSMVSGWELGRHTTSIGHRKTLCEIYEQPPDVLFAHQDRGLAAGAGLRLVAGFAELQQAMLATVTGRARVPGGGWGRGRAMPGTWRRSRRCWPSVLAWCATGCCSARPGIRC